MMPKKAFTFVELIIGITLSMILMVSVGVFVSTGMKHILFQEKILHDSRGLETSLQELQSILFHTESSVEFSNGLLLKTTPFYNYGSYTYIGTEEKINTYCEAGSEVTNTDHLVVKSFVPFEEVGEDINDNFSDILTSQEITIGTITYRSNARKHVIEQKQASGEFESIIGIDTYGYKFSQGASGRKVHLNNPTGLTNVDDRLVFSDTLNNRILYLSGSLVYSLLDESDGLKEPTGLAYDDTNKTLYIANSGKGEILKLHSYEYTTNPPLEINFSPKNNFTADNFELSIFTGSIILDSTLTSNDAVFVNINSDVGNDAIKTEGNNINYHFIDSYGSDSGQTDCSAGDAGNTIITSTKEVIDCVSTGTGKLATHANNTFNSAIDYTIGINNISPLLSNKQHYYIEAGFFQGEIKQYTDTFTYFTQGDGDVFTPDNNVLEKFITGLEYPTGISLDSTSNEITVNEFENREQTVYGFDSVEKTTSNLATFSVGNFINYDTVFMLENPLEDFSITIDGSLINLRLDYYLYLNCFNPDDKSVKTAVLKKDLP